MEQHLYIHKQPYGWNFAKSGHKSKFFRGSMANALEQAIAYRNQVLGYDPDKKKKARSGKKKLAPATSLVPKTKRKTERKTEIIEWADDSRTYELQFKILELEEELSTSTYRAKVLGEELIQTRELLEEQKRNRKISINEIEFERFRPMDTMIIVDGNYLFHQDERTDIVLIRKMLEGMIGGRAEAFIYVSSLPSDEEMRRRTEGYLNRLSSASNGAGATVIAHELKETTITCPRCSSRFERRFQWAGDTVIASEITYWAYAKEIPRIILLAGDGDFIYPVQLAARKCKEVVIAGFRNSLSSSLQGAANRTLFLDDYMNVIKR